MKNIPTFEGKYSATKDGRIYSHRRNKFMRSYRSQFGYRRIGLSGRQIFVHRLVALTYIPNPDNKPFINHKNGNRQDNRVENLEWCTRSENIAHAINILGSKYGKREFGTSGYPPRLTLNQAQNVRHLRGTLKAREIAKLYGITQTSVSEIWCNKTYKV